MAQLGYVLETLPPPNRESVEVGLKYCNNEICYPGIIYIGDIIKTLQSGQYDLTQVAVGSWQTGGQCRASCILTGLQRAMISAGFEDVPIAALALDRTPNDQPGFDPDLKRLVYKSMLSLAFADSLSAMYHATAARELHEGEALARADEHMAALADGSVLVNKRHMLEHLGRAVRSFNAIDTSDRELPAAGIVGEIFVKYNSFANVDVTHWLMGQGVEVVAPSMMTFFLGWLLGPGLQIQANLKWPSIGWLVSEALGGYANTVLGDVDVVMADFRYNRPRHSIREIARSASKAVTLAHQYGESWLIAGEVGQMAASGVRNFLCLQPFGCIANQVVARGISRRLKREYPGINILFLDLDAGMSHVNLFNRLHFFVSHAKRYCAL